MCKTWIQEGSTNFVLVNLMQLSSSYSIVRNVQINIKRIYLYCKTDIHESFCGIKGQIDKIPISTHCCDIKRTYLKAFICTDNIWF